MFTPFGYKTLDIVRDGLVFLDDANDRTSYPGTGGTWKDLSLSGYDGTFTNGPTYSSANGGSIVFDGVDDRSDLGNSIPLIRPDETHLNTYGFTVLAWVKSNSNSSFQGIYGSDGVNQGAYYYGIDCFINGAGYYGIEKSNGGIAGSQSRATRISTYRVQIGVWTHAAFNFVTASSSTFQIYINGSAVTMNSPTGGGGAVGYSTSLTGAIGHRRDHVFNGNIAYVHMYNRSLSVAEIQQNYEATKHRFI